MVKVLTTLLLLVTSMQCHFYYCYHIGVSHELERMKLLCWHEENGIFEAMTNGILQCIISIARLWKLNDIVVFIIDNQTVYSGGNFNWVEEFFDRHRGTTSIHILKIGNNSCILNQIQESINQNDTFVVLGSDDEVLHFMQTVSDDGLMDPNHIWLLQLQISAAIGNVLNFSSNSSALAQIVSLHESDDVYQGCASITVFDVFYANDVDGMVAVQFGEWKPQRGFFMFETLRRMQRMLGLQGRLIKGSIYDYKSYSIIKKKDDGMVEFEGYITSVIRSVMHYLDAKLDIHASKFTSAGIKVNNVLTGVAGTLYRREFDISLTPMGLTLDRYEGISFLYPVRYTTMGLWLQVRGKIFSPVAHVLTFSLSVWMLLFVTTILLSIFAVLPNVFHLTHSYVEYGMAFMKQLLSGEFFSNKINHLSSKVIIGTLLLFSLIVSTYYSSVLMSFLTYSTSLPFSDVDGLLETKSFKITTVYQDYYHVALRHSNSGILHALWQRMLNDEVDLVNNTLQGLQSLCKDPDIVFLTGYESPVYMAKHQYQDCHVNIIKTPYNKGYVHIGVRKEFPYTKVFSRMILRMAEVGILDCLLKRYFDLHNLKTDLEDGQDYVSLNLVHFTVPFCILTGGVILSLLVFLLEISLSKINVKVLKLKYRIR